MIRRDNYIIARDRARELFLAWDQRAMIDRAKIRADDADMYISMIDMLCRVERATGRVYLPDGTLAGFDETLTIYDYLCRTGAIPEEGEWVTMGNLPHTGQVRPEGNSLFAREAIFLQERLPTLPAALARIGASPYPHGDIGAIVPIVGGMRAAFQFWEGDDEFAPNVSFLWDANAWQKLKCETMYYAMGSFFRRLRTIISEIEN